MSDKSQHTKPKQVGDHEDARIFPQPTQTTTNAITCELCWADFDPDAEGAATDIFDCCPACAHKVLGGL